MNPDNVKRGKSNKRRGADAERRLAAIIRDQYGYDVRRGYASANMPDLIGLDGIHIEAKYVMNLNIRKAMEQSKRDAEKFKDGEPVVIHGKPREEWLVTMPLSLFMDMYTSYNSDVEVHGETK